MGASAGKMQEKYHIQKVKLGEGSFGIVWRAMDKSTNAAVAIKCVEKEKMKKRGVTPADMEREIAMLWMAKGCQYITELRDTYEDTQSHYLALEYCEGGDFGDKLKEKSESLQEWQACFWMKQILLAIDFLAAKVIIHRDIKPDNFMLSSHSNNGRLKLSDFGLAIKLPSASSLLRDKCGTPAFMAPEQHNLPTSAGYSFPIDIFAAGTCLWCILHGGEHPYMDGNHLNLMALLAGQPKFVGNTSFWGSAKWSRSAQDLCDQLTDKECKNRPSAKQALDHVWFKEHAKKVEKEIGAVDAAQKAGNAGTLSSDVDAYSNSNDAYGGYRGTDKKTNVISSTGQSESYSGLSGIGNYGFYDPSSGGGIGSPTADGADGSRKKPSSNTELKAVKQENEALQEKIKELEKAKEAGTSGGTSGVTGGSGFTSFLAGMGAVVSGAVQAYNANTGDGNNTACQANGSTPSGVQKTQHAMIGGPPGGANNLSGNAQTTPQKREPTVNMAAILGGKNSNSNPSAIGNGSNIHGASILGGGTAASGSIFGGGAAAGGDKDLNPNNIPGLLKVGAKVCYNSASHDAWYMGSVLGYNSDDNTYNLDLKQRATCDRISPPFQSQNGLLAWPPGTSVLYKSESSGNWIPGIVSNFNVDDETYNLNIKQRAIVEKIRIRPPNEVVHAIRAGDPTSGQQQQFSYPNRFDFNAVLPVGGEQVVGRLVNPFGAPSEQQGGSSPSGYHQNSASGSAGSAGASGNNLISPGKDQYGSIASNYSNPYGVKSNFSNPYGSGTTDNVPPNNTGGYPSSTIPNRGIGGAQSIQSVPSGGGVQPDSKDSTPHALPKDGSNPGMIGVNSSAGQHPGNQNPAQRLRRGGSIMVSDHHFYGLSGILKPQTVVAYRKTDADEWRSAIVDSVSLPIKEGGNDYLEPEGSITILLETKKADPNNPYDFSSNAVNPATYSTEKIKAIPSQIAPISVNNNRECNWPQGTWVLYHSASLNKWLPSVIHNFNKDDGSVNLSNKPRAPADRIRARLMPEPQEREAIQNAIAENQQEGRNHQQMTCENCGRVYWSLTGRTKVCPACRG